MYGAYAGHQRKIFRNELTGTQAASLQPSLKAAEKVDKNATLNLTERTFAIKCLF